MRHWLGANIIDERVRLLDEIIGILTATITTLRRQTNPPANSSVLREEPEIYESEPFDPGHLSTPDTRHSPP